MSKKIGLALGAGGSRGVAHIGVLKALEEEGIRPDYISGCSMGSVVGACYANGVTVDEMLNIVNKIKALNLMDLNVLGFNRLALFRGDKVQNLLVSSIGKVDFKDLKIPFRCIATDLYSGTIVTFKEGDVALATRASSSIPGVFQPVEYDGKLLVDGCVLCRMPIDTVKEMGADVVIAVDVLDNTKEPVEKVKNVISMTARIFDIIDYDRTWRMKEHYGTENEVWVVPEMKGLSQYAVKDFDIAYAEGYAETKKMMPQIKKLIGME